MSYIGQKPADKLVTSSDMEDNIITSAKIVDGAIVTADIADTNVTLAKLSATGTKNSTTFLRGDNTFATAGLTGVTTDSGNVTITDGNLTFGGAGHGVHLGVTSATAANLLDDYEEGTWTPVMTTSGGSLSSVTYGAYNLGWYTKVGRNVTINFNVHLNSKGSGGSGAVRMSGYPFSGTTLLTASVYGSLYMYNGGVDQPCCTYGTWQNHQTIRYVNAGSGGEITWANISNGSSWSGMMTYITNQ